jgi:hypothetical protein
MSVGSNIVPHFVTATTPEMLIRKMALVAAKRGTYIPFRDIQFVNGKWFSWYDTELKLKIKRNDNGISKE